MSPLGCLETSAENVRCQLTTPHKLQGGGSIGKPALAVLLVYPKHEPIAAPCQLQAVVRCHNDGSAGQGAVDEGHGGILQRDW
jgi:hypothetical protein